MRFAGTSVSLCVRASYADVFLWFTISAENLPEWLLHSSRFQTPIHFWNEYRPAKVIGLPAYFQWQSSAGYLRRISRGNERRPKKDRIHTRRKKQIGDRNLYCVLRLGSCL